MIRVENGLFSIETAHTGYYIALRGALAETLHYGAKLRPDRAALCEKVAVPYGGDAIYQKSSPDGLSHLCLELAPVQKGDLRAGALLLQLPNGGRTLDFSFRAARQRKGSVPPSGMPGAFDGDDTLALDFVSPEGVLITLSYTVYEDCDVITRRMTLRNGTGGALTLEKAMSYQLDLPSCDFVLSTFTGAWARERHETQCRLTAGTHSFGSLTGTSSHLCNPFFMLAAQDATEHTGDVYGFNLIYSGSHAGSVEVTPFGQTRVMAGLQPEGFCWTLAPDEVFETPEAVLSFSQDGKNGMSAHMHRFVNRHLVRGAWANAERPILINNWEATYFHFNEAKLLKLAKAAAKLGIELFVLDDGWFGARSSDTAGLGDYNVNRKKLPDGLAGLAQKIKALGMRFGLWVEPEMVNADSDLYRAHPDWVIASPGHTPCEGRHQLVLDLCRSEVQDYLIENVNRTLKSAEISYVKWDMNRPISDAYSPALQQQGRFAHSYTLGLYRVLDAVTRANPEVLFEGCSMGGNRFDLGILSYMPQIWTSDDTDAYERQKIQTGTSYGYPQSTMGCHVSAVPNHQSARVSPLDARFDVAAFGVLGYELDLTLLPPAELKAVAAQIVYYKAHRRLLQYGQFLRLASPFAQDKCEWMVVSEDKKEAMLGEYLHLLVPNTSKPPLRFKALDPDALYTVTARAQSVNIRAFGGLLNFVLPFKVNPDGVLVQKASELYGMPCEKECYTVYGDLLMGAGLKQKQAFTGTGYTKDVRLMPDFSARIYFLQAHSD
ncbi:MAG: alpha-galactosidase [Ruthenibacterium sp.]